MTDEEVLLPLSAVNLISLETWTDLITDHEYNATDDTIELSPCGFVWLTNKVY